MSEEEAKKVLIKHIQNLQVTDGLHVDERCMVLATTYNRKKKRHMKLYDPESFREFSRKAHYVNYTREQLKAKLEARKSK